MLILAEIKSNCRRHSSNIAGTRNFKPSNLETELF